MRGIAWAAASAGLAILPSHAASVDLSSHAAGARPVDLALQLAYDMQCGWPGPKIDVVFPKAERLPAQIVRETMLVNGKTPQSTALMGRTLEIAIARPTGVMCDVIGPGRVRVELTRAAAVGNPDSAGTYALVARHGTTTLRTTFAIH